MCAAAHHDPRKVWQAVLEIEGRAIVIPGFGEIKAVASRRWAWSPSTGHRLCYTARPMGDSVPLAYFITFRTYGTWLHGDERGAVDRFHNYYGTPLIPPDND